MFIASLAEKFQAFGDGAGPISCPQFEYPILVPPAQRYELIFFPSPEIFAPLQQGFESLMIALILLVH